MSNIEHEDHRAAVEWLMRANPDPMAMVDALAAHGAMLGWEVKSLRQQLEGAVDALDALNELLGALDDTPAPPNDPTWAAIVKARGTLRELRGGQ